MSCLRADSWRALSALPTLARLRPAALDSVCAVPLLNEYLNRRRDVDARRIVLIGGSLRSAVMTVGEALIERVSGLVTGRLVVRGLLR